MIKEQAAMLQEDFENVCRENGIKAAFGFFIDKDVPILKFARVYNQGLLLKFIKCLFGT